MSQQLYKCFYLFYSPSLALLGKEICSFGTSIPGTNTPRFLLLLNLAQIYFPQLEPTARDKPEAHWNFRRTKAHDDFHTCQTTTSQSAILAEEEPYIADELSTASIPFPHFPSSDSEPDHQLTPTSQESFSGTPLDYPEALPEEEDDAEFIIPEHFCPNPQLSASSSPISSTRSTSPIIIRTPLPPPVLIIAPIPVHIIAPIPKMSANLAQMPIKGSNKAPTFDGKTDELVEFLENVSDLADAAGLKDQLKIKACLKYASRDEVEAWEMCPETTGSDFAKFVTAIKELYT